ISTSVLKRPCISASGHVERTCDVGDLALWANYSLARTDGRTIGQPTEQRVISACCDVLGPRIWLGLRADLVSHHLFSPSHTYTSACMSEPCSSSAFFSSLLTSPARPCAQGRTGGAPRLREFPRVSGPCRPGSPR